MTISKNLQKDTKINYLERIKRLSLTSFKLLPANKHKMNDNHQSKSTNWKSSFPFFQKTSTNSYFPIAFIPVSPCRFYLSIKKCLCVPEIELIADDKKPRREKRQRLLFCLTDFFLPSRISESIYGLARELLHIESTMILV